MAVVCSVIYFQLIHFVYIPGLEPAAGGHNAEFWPTLAVAAFTLTAAFELLG